MIPNLPIYISLIFIITALATVFLFYNAVSSSPIDSVQKKAKTILLLQLLWLVLQTVLSLKGVYNSNLNVPPPKLLVFAVLPPLIVILLMFVTKPGRTFMDGLPLKQIMYVNVVRIAVEIVLFLLSLQGAVPVLMTFEGGNLDILSGLTAPVAIYFGFKKPEINRGLLITWNFICLALLTNIVIRAILSLPLPLQKFALGHPNIALLNFPFVWLPSFVVPTVLFGHLYAIRKLFNSDSKVL
jgi:hypothetical protein